MPNFTKIEKISLVVAAVVGTAATLAGVAGMPYLFGAVVLGTAMGERNALARRRAEAKLARLEEARLAEAKLKQLLEETIPQSLVEVGRMASGAEGERKAAEEEALNAARAAAKEEDLKVVVDKLKAAEDAAAKSVRAAEAVVAAENRAKEAVAGLIQQVRAASVAAKKEVAELAVLQTAVADADGKIATAQAKVEELRTKAAEVTRQATEATKVVEAIENANAKLLAERKGLEEVNARMDTAIDAYFEAVKAPLTEDWKEAIRVWATYHKGMPPAVPEVEHAQINRNKLYLEYNVQNSAVQQAKEARDALIVEVRAARVAAAAEAVRVEAERLGEIKRQEEEGRAKEVAKEAAKIQGHINNLRTLVNQLKKADTQAAKSLLAPGINLHIIALVKVAGSLTSVQAAAAQKLHAELANLLSPEKDTQLLIGIEEIQLQQLATIESQAKLHRMERACGERAQIQAEAERAAVPAISEASVAHHIELVVTTLGQIQTLDAGAAKRNIERLIAPSLMYLASVERWAVGQAERAVALRAATLRAITVKLKMPKNSQVLNRKIAQKILAVNIAGKQADIDIETVQRGLDTLKANQASPALVADIRARLQTLVGMRLTLERVKVVNDLWNRASAMMSEDANNALTDSLRKIICAKRTREEYEEKHNDEKGCSFSFVAEEDYEKGQEQEDDAEDSSSSSSGSSQKADPKLKDMLVSLAHNIHAAGGRNGPLIGLRKKLRDLAREAHGVISRELNDAFASVIKALIRPNEVDLLTPEINGLRGISAQQHQKEDSQVSNMRSTLKALAKRGEEEKAKAQNKQAFLTNCRDALRELAKTLLDVGQQTALDKDFADTIEALTERDYEHVQVVEEIGWIRLAATVERQKGGDNDKKVEEQQQQEKASEGGNAEPKNQVPDGQQGNQQLDAEQISVSSQERSQVRQVSKSEWENILDVVNGETGTTALELLKIFTWIKELPEARQQEILSSSSMQQISKILETSLHPHELVRELLSIGSIKERFESEHGKHYGQEKPLSDSQELAKVTEGDTAKLVEDGDVIISSGVQRNITDPFSTGATAMPSYEIPTPSFFGGFHAKLFGGGDSIIANGLDAIPGAEHVNIFAVY